MGITTQRSTFITWERNTGRHFHNFITWQDLRANSLVDKWNSNYYLRIFNAVSGALYFLTRNGQFLTGKVLRFLNPQVIVRLAWIIRSNPEIKKAMDAGSAMCGTLESWLLYKLRLVHKLIFFTNKNTKITDCALYVGKEMTPANMLSTSQITQT